MAVFTIPFNYDEAVDRGTIPVCISDTDDEGNPVHFGWIERGVVPVANKLPVRSLQDASVWVGPGRIHAIIRR
jgi:hypothetical protein